MGLPVCSVGSWFLPGRLVLRLCGHLHQVSRAPACPLLLLIWESLLCNGLVSAEDVSSHGFSPALSTVKASHLSPFGVSHTYTHNSRAYLFKSNLELFSPEPHLFSHERLDERGRQRENRELLSEGGQSALRSLQEAAPTHTAAELNPPK